MIRDLLKKYSEHKAIIKPTLLYGIPSALYLIGFLATGKGPGGFSIWPHHVVMALFSPLGSGLLSVAFLLAVGAWAAYSVRNLQFFGMKKDPRNFRYSDKGTYGTSEFMDEKRMLKMFHCVPESEVREAEGNVLGICEGMCISRPAASYHNKNLAAFGSSGSMKSRAVIRNSIIGCQRRGESMLLTDPKGELFGDTAVWLRKSGYVVRVLNLVSLDKSNGWNFLEDALKDANGNELEIVEQISHVIINNTKDTTSVNVFKDDFWDKGERGLLKAIMLYQFYMWKLGLGPLAFSHAYDFLLNNELEQLRKEFEVLNRRYPGNSAWSQFNIFLKAGERVCPNIHFGLLSRLSIFNNQRVCEITGRNQMDLVLPAKQKCAYFIITPDQDSTYDFVACLFFTLFFIRVIKYADTETPNRRCPVPVNCLLDEFPNIGEIPDFEKKMATVRSRDVSITILFQSIPQLEQRYPKNSHYGILGNADFKVFLGTDDPITAKYVSDRAGVASVLVETTAEEHNKFDPLHFTVQQRESRGVGKRNILTQDEVLMMAMDDPFAAIVIMRDQPILECQKFDYTRNPEANDWEILSMSEFKPDDPFWGADESYRPPSAPAAPTIVNTKPSLPQMGDAGEDLKVKIGEWLNGSGGATPKTSPEGANWPAPASPARKEKGATASRMTQEQRDLLDVQIRETAGARPNTPLTPKAMLSPKSTGSLPSPQQTEALSEDGTVPVTLQGTAKQNLLVPDSISGTQTEEDKYSSKTAYSSRSGGLEI
jgi:type IV secretion system protein VirD4